MATFLKLTRDSEKENLKTSKALRLKNFIPQFNLMKTQMKSFS